MGRKSTKENKNVYQTSRESLGLTRESAAEKLEFLSADRIEKSRAKSRFHTRMKSLRWLTAIRILHSATIIVRTNARSD